MATSEQPNQPPPPQPTNGQSTPAVPPPPTSQSEVNEGGTATDDQWSQILKVRDDRKPIYLKAGDEVGTFLPTEGSYKPTWHDSDGSPITTPQLRTHIEPWLTALFQSEHLSLLLGSGLTIATHWLSAGSAPSGGMSKATFGVYDDEILAEANDSAEEANRASRNIEDQIRIACNMIAGITPLQRIDGGTGTRGWAKETVATLNDGLNTVIRSFAASILNGEAGIISAEEDARSHAFQYLTSFLMSFASRTGTRDRLNVFTTNYDRCIEAAADLAGLRLIDRFVGSLNPVFRSSRLDIDLHYNPPGIRGEPRYLEGVARYTKLHGSVDWVETQNAIRRMGLPFGAASIDPYLNSPDLAGAEPQRLMIYPNASKDRETSQYPYVELFRDLSAATCRPNSTVITYGYSFGDEHINRVIEDMLTIPSTHLVIISMDDQMGRIRAIYEKRPAQISLLVGDHFGDLTTLVDTYLPKPAIDRTTFRMAEILKSRFGPGKARSTTHGSDDESPF